MSLRSAFKRVGRLLKPLLPAIVGALPGGQVVAPFIVAGQAASRARRATQAPMQNTMLDYGTRTVSRGFNAFGGSSMSLLPAIIGTGARAVLPGAGRVVTGAVRRYGGTAAAGAAGAALYDAAGNLVSSGRGRRRRSKGITGTELKAFKRVTHVLSTYCKTPAPMKRRTTRTKSCR